jgi:tetratricopeptide (TPR) repeat protein
MRSIHNELGGERGPIAIFVLLCLFGCERNIPTVQGTEMRAALADLASAEDVYYATNFKYSADQSTIATLTLPQGVTLTIESADQRGWRATATHEFGIETCSESGRNDGSEAIAVVEGPTCRMVGVTTTQRDVRGRKIVAATPVDPPTPAEAEGPTAETTASSRNGTPDASMAGEISLLLPLAGQQTDDFGYPAPTVDRLAVRRLLVHKSYDALDRVLAAYGDSVLRDYRVEYRLFDAYAAFGVAVPEFEPFLTEWVNKKPKSAAARLARASFFRASGWNARGTSYARKTTSKQFQGMEYFFERCADDLAAAHRLEPKSIVAYRQMIDIATTQSDRASARVLIKEATALQPHSFLLRATYMNSLLPRWGGSYTAMAQFAAESAPFAARNPRIKALAGFADWDKGRLSESAGNRGDAIEAYGRALQFGNFWQFRYQRGVYNSRSDQNEEALEDFNSVLSQYPQNDEALSARATVEYELGRNAFGEAKAAYFSQAFRDIALAATLDPANEEYQSDLAFYNKNIPEYAPPPES